MTDEVAEKNNVVAAACCKWCEHYDFDGKERHVQSFCDKLQTMTWSTDICKHFNQLKGAVVPIMKKDNKTEKEDKYVGTVTISIPKDMFDRLQKKAKEDFRDLNMEILYAIDRMLNDDATINYSPVWENIGWNELWPGNDKNTTPIRPVNFPDSDPNKNWDGSPKVTCSHT